MRWWDRRSLAEKLAYVLLPLVVIGTVCSMIFLNFTLHVSFLNSNDDVSGWGSLLIGSAIGIYITFAILIYSDASQKKISEIITRQNDGDKKRKKIAKDRICKNLLAQSSLLASLQRDKDHKKAINAFTGKEMDMEAFTEKGLQFNNTELKILLNSSSDVIDSELSDELIEISGKFDFIGRFKEEIVERGEWLILTLIRRTIEKHFPERLSEFDNLGGSTKESHDFSHLDKNKT